PPAGSSLCPYTTLFRSGTVPMLRDVSLTVAKGELVCLLGPNGAGKSTTFNTICGLVAPDRGRVRIMGQDVAATGTERLGALGVGDRKSTRLNSSHVKIS